MMLRQPHRFESKFLAVLNLLGESVYHSGIDDHQVGWRFAFSHFYQVGQIQFGLVYHRRCRAVLVVLAALTVRAAPLGLLTLASLRILAALFSHVFIQGVDARQIAPCLVQISAVTNPTTNRSGTVNPK